MLDKRMGIQQALAKLVEYGARGEATTSFEEDDQNWADIKEVSAMLIARERRMRGEIRQWRLRAKVEDRCNFFD